MIEVVVVNWLVVVYWVVLSFLLVVFLILNSWFWFFCSMVSFLFLLIYIGVFVVFFFDVLLCGVGVLYCSLCLILMCFFLIEFFMCLKLKVSIILFLLLLFRMFNLIVFSVVVILFMNMLVFSLFRKLGIMVMWLCGYYLLLIF